MYFSPRRFAALVGFWDAVERHLRELETNPSKRQRWFKVAWFLSTAFVLFGFIIIAATLAGWM